MSLWQLFKVMFKVIQRPKILMSDYREVNNDIMELLIMAYACKTSSARNIIGVIPYLPYCKQSKMRKRGSIVCRLLADMLAKAGKQNNFQRSRNVGLNFDSNILISLSLTIMISSCSWDTCIVAYIL